MQCQEPFQKKTAGKDHNEQATSVKQHRAVADNRAPDMHSISNDLPVVKFGAFFSGIETPSIALMHLNARHQLMYAMERETELLEYITAKYMPLVTFDDVVKATHSRLPAVDIFSLLARLARASRLAASLKVWTTIGAAWSGR